MKYSSDSYKTLIGFYFVKLFIKISIFASNLTSLASAANIQNSIVYAETLVTDHSRINIRTFTEDVHRDTFSEQILQNTIKAEALKTQKFYIFRQL